MKKLIALLLILSSLLILTACTKGYEPAESTDEEARIVLTLKFGGKTYGVRYELYRALFLTYKSDVDGGDEGVWSGADADEYIAKIEERIIERATDIYATFALAESLGIDPYSKKVEAEIADYIDISVEGGSHGGVTYPGYDTHDEYRAALRALYLNDSVQLLLFRYSIVSDMIDDYYMGTLTVEDIESGVKDVVGGHLEYTREDVRAFYDGDDTVRVLRTFVSEDMSLDPLARAESVAEAVRAAASGGEESVRLTMVNKGSTTSVPELEAGYVMARHNLARSYYGEMVDTAFSLGVGEVGGPIGVHDGNKMAYYIIYRAEKSEAHFNDNYASIAYIYLRNEIGKEYARVSAAMIESAEATAVLGGIVHADISM